MTVQYSSLSEFLKSFQDSKKLEDLSTDELTLFNFLTLITDIKYRAKYGHSLERTDGKGYSKNVKNLPEQIISVDDGLEGVSQRRLLDAD